MKKNKILILHDTFLYKGGGERLILMMGKALGADIASGFFSPGSFDLRKEGFTGKMIPLSTEIFTKGLRHLKLKYSFVFGSKVVRDYDTVIFSGDALGAVRNCHKNTKKIYYCHTPPRYIYDLHDLYCQKISWYMLPFFKLGCGVFRYFYERDLKKIDLIIANSKNTQTRIKKYLGYDSKILYPPVDLNKFQYQGQKGYFLSFARLSDAKRVDKIVEAFTELTSEKLIVIYGKNDPQKEKIFQIGEGCENIEFITLENNDDLYSFIGNARATIYIPIDEDFGMSPVESMSAGKPVLGVSEGGLKETLIHKKTGYLVPAGGKVSDIIEAVQYLDIQTCESMREDCEARASEFGLNTFELQLKDIIS